MSVTIAQGNELLAGVLMAGAALLVIVVVVSNLRRRSQRDAATQGYTPRDKVERIRSDFGAREQVREAVVELHDMVRRVSAQLDAKSRQLEALIEEADRKLIELRRATGGDESDSPAPQSAPPLTKVDEPADAPADVPAPREDRLTRKVYEMTDAGCDPVQIAKELDEQIGKVELILALRSAG